MKQTQHHSLRRVYACVEGKEKTETEEFDKLDKTHPLHKSEHKIGRVVLFFTIQFRLHIYIYIYTNYRLYKYRLPSVHNFNIGELDVEFSSFYSSSWQKFLKQENTLADMLLISYSSSSSRSLWLQCSRVSCCRPLRTHQTRTTYGRNQLAPAPTQESSDHRPVLVLVKARTYSQTETLRPHLVFLPDN